MKRRIHFSMILLTSLSAVIISALLCVVFYNQFSKQIKKDIKDLAQVFLNDDINSTQEEFAAYMPHGVRITIVRPDGSVVVDNMTEGERLENHLDREEISEAFKDGMGESRRVSDTLGQETYYYAVRLTDGGVLRIAKSTNSILKLFASILPVVIFILLLLVIASYLLAVRLTKRIVSPINNVDLNGELVVPYDELAPFVKTISDHRKQIEQDYKALQRSTETISAITENMAEGMILVDGDGVILNLNKSAAAIFSVENSKTGRNILELLRDIDLLDNVKLALAGNHRELNFEKNKKIYRVLISPVAEMGAILFFLDITARFQADKMRREFSANVSHELRTPLTSIYGYSEMLRDGIVAEADRKDFYDKIKTETSRLISLVGDVMRLSELDEEKFDRHFEKLKLASISKECVESLSKKAEENEVTLSIKGDGEISGNYSMIYEVVYNLVDNAIKYNKQGGFVEISIYPEGEFVKLSVKDSGIGIPSHSLERVFERFYRGDKSRSKKSGGTGLGLAIVKHIVMVHKGKIDISSKLDEGTEIVLSFKSV